MNNIKDFFKSIYNDDIIYHYTKASTAIDYILYNEQLRFNSRRNSIDPIESRTARRSSSYYGPEKEESISKKHVKDCNELHEDLSSLEDRFHQICFCKNHKGSDFANEQYLSGFSGHEELFGFTKPRMWEQYADNYNGVCTTFSKEKILNLNSNKIDLLNGNVRYLSFMELSEKKIGDISGNYLLNVGKDKYKEQNTKKVKESYFYKHKDYSGENEYRIGTLYEEKKCSAEMNRDEVIIGKTIMLDVSGCIEAIFISSYANNRQKKDLLNYAIKLDVPIIEMNWKHDSFEPVDYKATKELYDKLI